MDEWYYMLHLKLIAGSSTSEMQQRRGHGLHKDQDNLDHTTVICYLIIPIPII